MTDIEQKAQALVDEVRREYSLVADFHAASVALMRYIEQHEAFRQEVSDAVVEYFGPKDLDVILAGHLLSRFIIPKPKPDPLVEVLEKMGWYIAPNGPTDAENFRAALDALGFEIREKNDV